MAQVSKNARTSSSTQRFYCPCGGEVKMKTVFEKVASRESRSIVEATEDRTKFIWFA